jgi:hypothetical protein
MKSDTVRRNMAAADNSKLRIVCFTPSLGNLFA